MLLIVACYVPTTVGLRTDGILAPAGRGEAAMMAGEMLNGLGSEAWPMGPGFGATGHYTLADGVAVSGSLARYDTLDAAEAEVRVRALDEAKGPVTIAVLAGGGAVVGEAGAPIWGTHLGLVASHHVGGNLHTFVGGRANPVLTGSPATFRLFLDGGAGVSWRPPLGPGATGLFLLEGDWVHGADAGVGDSDVNAYVILGMMGISWR
ncbi:MAG: hypothetical protein ACOZNI_17290 [Myxococcota bacterium]